MVIRNRIALGTCAIAAGLAAGVAQAQGSERATLEEVVVTAQFQAQDLQSTPIAITALNAEMLEQRSVNNILDVTQVAPNVNMTMGGGQFGKSNFAYVRGIGQADFAYAFEPRVGFYIDDVYFSTVFGSIFDLLDVERVEVLRGPQGTLFGRNSVGGALRIFSKKPQGDGSGYVDITGGSYNRFDVKGSIDMGLVPERLALRLTGGSQSRDGHVDLYSFACVYPQLGGSLPKASRPGDCKLGTLGGTDSFSLRGALRWTPVDGVDNTFTADYLNDEGEPSPTSLTSVSLVDRSFGAAPNQRNGLAYAGQYIYLPYYGVNVSSPAFTNALLAAGPYRSYSIFGNPGLGGARDAPIVPARVIETGTAAQFNNPPISKIESWGVSNVLDWDLTEELHLKLINSLRRYTGAFGVNAQPLPVPLNESYNYLSHRQWTHEVQLSGGLFGEFLDWTIGAFYLDTSSRNFGRQQSEASSRISPANGLSSFSQGDNYIDDTAELTNEAAFVHGIAHLTERLNLTAGVRYSRESKRQTYIRDYRSFGAVATPNLYKVSPEVEISEVNPRVAVDYQFTDSLMAYASFSTGFTAGGFNARPFVASDADIFFEPEKAKAYEAGIKSEWFENRVRANFAAFFTDWTDLQLMTSGCAIGCVTTSPFYYDNAGDVEIKGLELETEAQLVPDWLLTASVGYTDFEYVELNPRVNSRNDPSGLTLNSPGLRTPEWKLSAGTQYEFHFGGGASLTPRLDVVHSSRIYFGSNPANPLTQQAPNTLLNARLTWRSPERDWSVAAFVTNLTDELYYTGRSDQLNTFGSAHGEVGRPREWGLTLRRNF